MKLPLEKIDSIQSACLHTTKSDPTRIMTEEQCLGQVDQADCTSTGVSASNLDPCLVASCQGAKRKIQPRGPLIQKMYGEQSPWQSVALGE